MAKIVLSVVLGGVIYLFFYMYNVLVLKPKILRSKVEKQGIRGPSPSILLGNIPDIKKIQQQISLKGQTKVGLDHDWSSTVFPFVEKWKNEYGIPFFFSKLSPSFLHILAEFSYNMCSDFIQDS